MALINRMARLFTADLHAVLDRMEEPDVLLRQAMREMDEAVTATERRIAELEHERASLATRREQFDNALSELTGQLDICFTSGNEELARKLIRRRLETERHTRLLAERQTGVDKSLAQARTQLAAQREQLENIRQKAELFDDRDDASHSPHDDTFGLHGADRLVGDDEVEVAFLREKQRRAPA